MKGLTDIDGILVGHVSDCEAVTGCTVVLCGTGAVGGVDVGGSATGSQELHALAPGHVADRVHAIVLAGGSAYGLEAASGVRRFLERQGIGFQTGAGVVPIVASAILYDLAIGRPDVRPTREMGEAAAEAANGGPVQEGAVGAGTGATVGKIFGMGRAMKGGVGSATVELSGGVLVSCLVVVNAFGDVRDPGTGRLVAGARAAPDSRELVGTAEAMKCGAVTGGFERATNTTLAVVATNALLDKVGARRLARLAGVGMARSIDPVNTTYDGDIVFALSVGERAAGINVLGVAAAEAVGEAVVRSVRLARTMAGVPGLAG